MIKAIIFDLDGVIFHSDKYHFQAWKCLADEYGIYFDEKINNRLRGVSRMASLEIILERYKGDTQTLPKVEMSEKKNVCYRKLLQQITPEEMNSVILNTLRILKKKGLKVAIGSSSKNAVFILERLGILNEFDAISDGNNITETKPNPEVFLKAAEYLGESTEYCIIVEDSIAGIEAGINAGMKTIAIGEATFGSVADYNISSFEEILDILDAMQAPSA